MNEYYVYILRCADNSYYTGVTNDLEKRVWEHQEGFDTKSYTHKRRPVVLVYTGIFGDINEAISWEKRVKRWSRRKKEALIQRNWDSLTQLSVCKNASHAKFVDIDRVTQKHIASIAKNTKDVILRLRSG